MLVAMPARTICVTPRLRSSASRPVPWKAPQVCLVTVMSVGCRSSSGTSSAQSAGGVPPGRPASVRPGAPPVTLTSTTGRSRSRKAAASRAERSTISAAGWAVGSAVMPF